jgi:methylmalonic aciduria homocystinuria type C protein
LKNKNFRYNENLPVTCTYAPLPTFSRTKSTLSILVANTKYLWPKFLNYYSTEILARRNHTYKTPPSSNHCATSTSYSEDSNNEEYKQQNPLDYYTRISITSTIKEMIQIKNLADLSYDVRYTFDLEEKNFVAFQILAENASFAYYNRACFLNVHEEYGPWIGLRTVITFDVEGPLNSSQLFPELRNPFPEGDEILERKLRETYDYASHVTSDETTDVNTKSTIKEEWHKFVELRDIASGFMDKKSLEKHRYSKDQIEYHYTNSIDLLNKLVLDKDCIN